MKRKRKKQKSQENEKQIKEMRQLVAAARNQIYQRKQKNNAQGKTDNGRAQKIRQTVTSIS